jgi:hypothetical protein
MEQQYAVILNKSDWYIVLGALEKYDQQKLSEEILAQLIGKSFIEDALGKINTDIRK